MIKPFLQRLRLQWFLATSALPFESAYLERVYQIYLNHTKVIHWRDGVPVYSLSTPALFSKPAANFLARSLYRSIQNKNLPNMMSFAVNDVCNARCEHCSFYEGVEEKGRSVLTVEQAQRVIRDAQELGVSVFNFVGGEPLLREDLPDIIRAVDKDLSTTAVFTNGAYLEERAPALRRAGLDSVYVSIDAAEPDRHDRFRGTPGLYAKAITGIQRAKALGFSVGISCSITPESFRDGELDRIIELGRRIGIHEVLVFDTMPTGRYKGRQDLVDNDEWVEEMIRRATDYNKDAAYPGILVWAYTASHRSVGCSCGTNFFYVSPYGDVMSCDFNHAKFGNVLERPLYRIWDELSAMDDFSRSKWGGCKIKDSSYLERATVSPG